MDYIPVYIACTFLLLFVILRAVYAHEKKSRAEDFGIIKDDPGAVMAYDSAGDMVRVDLPPGVTSDKVKAVYVVRNPEKAKVKVLHEKVNRHNTNNSTDHDMSI